jgi:hypothetical protein
MRWEWVSTAAIAGLAIAGCGGSATPVVTKTVTASAQSHSIASNGGGGWGGGAYTSPVKLPLPFDPEETTFMGGPDPQHHGLDRTGCFAEVATFDAKSEEVCDCAYRELRSEGHPASQLAAISASISENAEPHLGPMWFNVPITRCWADLDGGK